VYLLYKGNTYFEVSQNDGAYRSKVPRHGIHSRSSFENGSYE